MFDLTICGVHEVPGHLAKTKFTHAVSLSAPGTEAPDGLSKVPHVLRLQFDDVEHERVHIMAGTYAAAPTVEHIQAIAKFGRRVAEAAAAPNSEVRLLVHCHAGISRSTAAAVIICTFVEPDLRKAVAMVFGARPQAYPNRRMLALADDELEMGGALVRSCARFYQKSVYGSGY